MMVSKIAVIALVAIVACPILMGYAMNLTEVTEKEYIESGEPVNVTPILQNGIGYNYVNASSYQLNTDFGIQGTPSLPIFESISTINTALKLKYVYYPSGNHPFFGGENGITFSTWERLYYQSNNDISGGYITVYYRYPDGTLIETFDRVHSIDYNSKTMKLSITYYTSPGSLDVASVVRTVPDNTYKIGMSDTGGYVADGYIEQTVLSDTEYADLSSGFHFVGKPDNWWIKFPSHSNSILITINLDSITDANYSVKINSPATSGYVLEKTTTLGEVSWKARNIGNPSQVFDLYYDPSRSDNTYQYYLELNKTGENSYTSHREFRYVGGWPTLIGLANAYATYSDDVDFTWPVDVSLDYIVFYDSSNGRSPVIRSDAALFRASEYPVIENKTYSPSSFKTNPSTTINDIVVYGSSLSFGGNTYIVKNGNITIGSHSIPVRGLALSSVLVDGWYENRIGNTVISTTLSPSTITFTGQWSASITTVAMEEKTYTKTEWTPGEFGWDGIDQNFLMVGLLTSLGVFIALGIYIRRTKANLWPLLVVCGGAAMLFFCML